MVYLLWLILAVSAVGCAALAAKLARSLGRSPVAWAVFTVGVGVVVFVVENFVWTRPEGDSAAPAGFDMQSLLPVFAMLGAAFMITQLPPRDEP